MTSATTSGPPIAARLSAFGETIFAEITRLAIEHDAINLGQGFPNFDGPQFVRDAAIEAIRSGHNQYCRSAGIPPLTEVIRKKYEPLFDRALDANTEITVTTGCSEGIAASMLGLLEPGDEVIVLEPYYDSYRACLSMAGAVPRFVTLRPPDFALAEDELRAHVRGVGGRTRAVLLNTPHNPTGRVMTAAEMESVARICREHDLIAITDEVYEHLVFEGKHIRLATLPGMWERTITLNSLGKTFSLTGWKIGWAIAPPHLTACVRAAHQFLTFCTANPLQMGAAAALKAPESYYREFFDAYRRRREMLIDGLARVGFEVYPPQGTYFAMADHTAFGHAGDVAFCKHLIEHVGVAAIPPSAFYHDPKDGADLVRFAFCKDEQVLRDAMGRMAKALTATT